MSNPFLFTFLFTHACFRRVIGLSLEEPSHCKTLLSSSVILQRGEKTQWGIYVMTTLFAETLKKLRTERGLSQIQLGKQMFVNNSTVARWESGTRLPDAAMITRLSKVLDVDIGTLLSAAVGSDESPNVILVDDSKAILSDGVAMLEDVLPAATITGFIWPQEAIEYAKTNRVALAILDIELGTASGLDLSRTMREINPRMNIVFLTAFPDYALDAWETEASGFIVKPLTPENIKAQLKKLRYPFQAGGAND